MIILLAILVVQASFNLCSSLFFRVIHSKSGCCLPKKEVDKCLWRHFLSGFYMRLQYNRQFTIFLLFFYQWKKTCYCNLLSTYLYYQYICNSRACFTSKKFNVPDGSDRIASWSPLLVLSQIPTELKEIL